jgi:hypothetical protein
MWYIHIKWSISQSQKRKKLMSFVGKWIELAIIMLSEISQAQKDKYHIFLYADSRPKK